MEQKREKQRKIENANKIDDGVWVHNPGTARMTPADLIEFYQGLLKTEQIQEGGPAHTRLKYLLTRHDRWKK